MSRSMEKNVNRIETKIKVGREEHLGRWRRMSRFGEMNVPVGGFPLHVFGNPWGTNVHRVRTNVPVGGFRRHRFRNRSRRNIEEKFPFAVGGKIQVEARPRGTVRAYI